MHTVTVHLTLAEAHAVLWASQMTGNEDITDDKLLLFGMTNAERQALASGKAKMAAALSKTGVTRWART